MAEDKLCTAKFSINKRQNPLDTFQQEDSPAISIYSANNNTVSVIASNISGSRNAIGLVNSGDKDKEGSSAILRHYS